MDQIIEMWKLGEKDKARFLVKTYKHILSENIYKYIYEKTEIISSDKIPELLIKAQKILGGKIFDQYGMEINDHDIIK